MRTSRLPAMSRLGARRVRARAAALLAIGLLVSCDGGPTAPSIGPPAALRVISGDEQSAPAGTRLPAPLIVLVLDADGNPVPQQLMNFVVTSGGGSIFAPAAQTNAQGTAQNLWTLGTVVGEPQVVEARAVDPATGMPLVFATFTATVQPGPAAALVRVSGETLTGALGTTLADSIDVRVVDSYGNAVPGVVVAWSAAGGSSVAPASSPSRANGVARASWTLGTRVGTMYLLTATAGSLEPVTFGANAAAEGASLVATVLRGDAQSGPAGELLPDSVVVAIRTADGRPVIGLPLMVTPSAGSVVTLVSATTDEAGEIRGTWTLPPSPGASTLAVRWRYDMPPLVTLTATGHAGAPAQVKLEPDYWGTGLYWVCPTMQCEFRLIGGTSGSVQVTPAGQIGAYGTGGGPWAVVSDRFGNPVAGATITWSATRSVVHGSSTTNASGVAGSRWVLSPEAGQKVVHATVSPGVSDSMFTSGSNGSAYVAMRLETGSLQLAAGRDTTLAVQLFSIRTGSTGAAMDTDYLTVASSNSAVASIEVVPGYPGRVRVVARASGTATLTGFISATGVPPSGTGALNFTTSVMVSP